MANPYENVFKPQAPTAGRISLDLGDDVNNLTIGGGFTIDPQSGDLGIEIAPGFSIDL